MANRDPKMAQDFVNKAEEKGVPVVNSKNTGYGSAAKRRMATIQQSRKEDEETDQKTMSSRNKKIGY